jgi:diguanylate cyclase (GGDEF)-like protein
MPALAGWKAYIMMTVINCIIYDHNPWLVAVAAILCIAGSWITSRLYQRTISTSGTQKIGWHVLAAFTAGVAIWCTHFVAMLGFDPEVPIGFDPLLTVASLVIAVFGATTGFAVASNKSWRFAPALGGAIVGLAISAMHYTGMIAYRAQGIVSWDEAYLVASVFLSVVLSSVALHVGVKQSAESADRMAAVLSLAIVALHFTGMAAFQVEPLLIDGSFSNPEALQALALAIAAMAFVIVIAGMVSYLIDDSSRAETVERLRRMALNDAVTGLPNRASFNERLEHELDLAESQHDRIALIGIDLDRFKEINDRRGHSVGDEVLRIIGKRMRSALRETQSEFVARTGGDEFAAIYRVDSDNGLSKFIERIEKAIFQPIRISDYDINPSASLGVAIFPNDGEDQISLVNNADLAMYRAKSATIGSVCFYEPAMDELVRARRSLAADLRAALDNDQLSLHYQVQTSVSTGQVKGYEALLRWNHPELGPISPVEFIPLAEENGLILQIGEWVLRSACKTAVTWDSAYKVAINLSPVQFQHPDLLELVADTLRDSGLPPERLELELTESAIFADKPRALQTLNQIKALGVSIALDDFGTGYSSLDTLRSFPFDRIKIDRTFLAEATPTPQSIAIIRAVLALGKSLEIPVLAEGIETENQLSMLLAEGCDEAQGFLLGRPMPLDKLNLTRWPEEVLA